MSKFNSNSVKFFAAVVLCLGVASAANAATFSSPIDTAQERMDVQTVLNANGASLKVDGKFGPMTIAAVKAFQTSKGLVADGKIGPMTRAALNAAGGSVSTGALCPNGMTLASNCTTAPSSTTGGSVSGLTGGAGDISLSSTSTEVESQVIEGAQNTKVLGFKVEASGSDVAVTNLKVSLHNTATTTASYRLQNVASEVSVWMNGTKVGSALVSDFSKDSDSTFTSGTNSGVNVYTKSIALNGAVVKMGSNSKATFYVAVTALPNIDTNDMQTTNWAVYVNNIRFQDGTGVVMTSSDTAGSKTTGAFGFADLATSGDVKVVVSKASTSPITQNVTVSTTASTKSIPLLDFNVKSTGSAVSFDSLNILTTVGTTGAADTYATIVDSIRLLDPSGNEIASIDGASSDLNDGIATFTLDDTYTIAKDTTAKFRVVADINKGIVANFTTGASLTATFSSFSPEDANGGIVTDTGSAVGSTQTLVYSVPVIALSGTPSLTLFTHTDGTTAGLEDTYRATIDFTVTAPDTSAIYVPLDTFSYGTNGTAGVIFTKTGGATVTSANVQYAGSDSLSGITETNSYRVDAGASQKFTLTVTLTGNDANGKIAMTGLWYETTDTTPNGSPLVTGLSNFYTPLVYLAK